MMRIPVIRLALVAASAVAVGACTSTSTKAGTNTSTTTPTSAPASTAAASTTTMGGAPADPHTLLLQLSDLPASVWKSGPHPADPTRRADDVSLDSCLGVPTIDDNETAVYFSDFTRSDNQSFAEAAVDVVKSAAYASRDFAAIKGPKSTGCAAATAKVVFDRQNQKSATKFTAGEASFIPAPAPFFGIRLSITLTLPNGTTEPAVSDTFYMQKGNDEAQYGFLTVGGPDTNAETTALASLAKRTQA